MSLKDLNPVNAAAPKRVAIVISNPTTSLTTGWPIGFWWSELTHPWYAFTKKGYAVTTVSPDGGACAADSFSDPRDASRYSSSDLISMGFIATPALAALVEHTAPVASLNVDELDAIVIAGGQAPMYTMESSLTLQQKFVEFYERGKIAAALCHGVAILRYARLSSGAVLATGKTVTGFANVEEDFADNAVWSAGSRAREKHVQPWRIEDEMRRIGANYVQAGCWRGFAIRDGNLITGQQNVSGGETARLIIAALGE